MKDRARRMLRAEHANAANSPDVHDLQGTPEDTLFAQAVRDGIQFVMTNEAVRFSEFQTVKVGTGESAEYRPRINLLESVSTIYAAYKKAFGAAALSESTFRRRCILPEMKPEGSRTCLCCHCEALLEAINSLIKLLRSPVLCSFLEQPGAVAARAAAARAASAAAAAADGAAAPAVDPVDVDVLLQEPPSVDRRDNDAAACHAERLPLLKRALALRRSFYDYGQAVRALVSADTLAGFTDSGKLAWADLPEVAGLAGLVASAAALVTLSDGEEEPAMAEWLDSLLPLAGELEKLTAHVARRTWQNVRYEQHLDLLSTYATADDKQAIILIWDFKEKVAAEMKMREVQGDYWKNSVISVLGVTVYWYDGERLRSRYIDLVSEDTSQDGVWMDTALPVVARVLLDMFPSGISVAVNWSDNGCHFHNSAMFAVSLPAFAALLSCGLSWNFFEAGEGKGPCDQHFAVMAQALKEAVRSLGALRGAEAIKAVIDTMNNTIALLLTVLRAVVPSRGWSYTGITAYKQFILQAVPESSTPEARLAALWHVRTVSGLADAHPLAAGSWSARWVKLPETTTRALLTRALQRRAGLDRQAALVALLGSDPLLADSKCFGQPAGERGETRVDTPAYLNALCALKFIIEKEYTSAERDAAAVGGQQKPHTIAQAIVQLEQCRDAAQQRSGSAGGGAAPLIAVPEVPPRARAAAPQRAADPPPPAPANAAAAAAAVLQKRIAAAQREEQVAAATATAKRKELVALRRDLEASAAQAASAMAMPLERGAFRAPAGVAKVAQRPNLTELYDI